MKIFKINKITILSIFKKNLMEKMKNMKMIKIGKKMSITSHKRKIKTQDLKLNLSREKPCISNRKRINNKLLKANRATKTKWKIQITNNSKKKKNNMIKMINKANLKQTINLKRNHQQLKNKMKIKKQLQLMKILSLIKPLDLLMMISKKPKKMKLKFKRTRKSH